MPGKRKAKQIAKTDSASSSDVDFENSLMALYQTRIDQIFLLQYAIRRFQAQAPEDFGRIMQLRIDLQGVLYEIPVDHPLKFGIVSDARFLESLMDFWAKSELILSPGSEQQDDILRQNLRAELDFAHLFHSASNEYFSDQILDRFIHVFRQHLNARDILSRYNYFDYYSAFAMSSLVKGETFYSHYAYTALGAYVTRPKIQSEENHRESRWLLTNEAQDDPELSPMVDTYCYEPGSGRSNVDIFGGSRNVIEVDGKRLTNRLVLSVPTDTPPHLIDHMLARFRTRLVEEATLENGGYHGISSPSFDNSVFISQFSQKRCLVTRWDQVQRHMLGLWAWDEYMKDKRTPEVISDHIEDILDIWKERPEYAQRKNLIPVFEFPKYSTILEHSRLTRADIWPRNPMERTKIDVHLFGKMSGTLGDLPNSTDMDEWQNLSDLGDDALLNELSMEDSDDFDRSRVLKVIGCINFSSDEELDQLLLRTGKKKEAENRETLRLIGKELAEVVGSIYVITHELFQHHLASQLHRLK